MECVVPWSVYTICFIYSTKYIYKSQHATLRGSPFLDFWSPFFFSGFSKSPSCHLTGTTVDDSEILQLSWHANSPISAICFTEISSGEPPIFWNINSVMNFRWSKFPNTKSSKNSKMIIFPKLGFQKHQPKFPKMPKTKRIWEDSGGFIRWLHRTLEYDDHVKPVKVDGWSRCYVWETSAKEYT